VNPENKQKQWLRLVGATAAATGRSVDVAAAMRKLIAAARREDPEHPAWPHVDGYDFAGDANTIAAGVRKVLASRKLKSKNGRVVFELDPVNLGGDGTINVFGVDNADDGDVADLGTVRSPRVLAKLYDWAEDGDAADVLVGLGFTAIAIARAVTNTRKLIDSPRIVISYHDSNIDPLVLGDVPKSPAAARTKKPPKPTTPAKSNTPDASPTAWRLRAAKYGDADAAAKAAVRAIEAGDELAAKTIVAALATALKRPSKVPYDQALSAIGGLYFVAERLGDRAKVKLATQLSQGVVKAAQARFPKDAAYRDHVRTRGAHAFERYKRGIKNGELWFLGTGDIPRPVWLPLLDAIRARRDGDAVRCRAVLKKLDAEIARAMKDRDVRKDLLKIGGDYAMLHGFCGNATKVREILRKFRDQYDGPEPEEAFTALFEAGDKKAAAAVASRELTKRLNEVTGKAGAIAALNAHHSLLQLEDIFEAQLAAGDREGVARGLEAIGKALAKSGRNTDTRAWALKTVADLELRIGRPERARAANEIAEKLAAKSRGAEIRSMSWRGVADVYSKLAIGRKLRRRS